jgi:hypothetical protein
MIAQPDRNKNTMPAAILAVLEPPRLWGEDSRCGMGAKNGDNNRRNTID